MRPTAALLHEMLLQQRSRNRRDPARDWWHRGPSVEISTVLLVMTGLSILIFVARLARNPPRQVVDWWGTLAVLVALSSGAFLLVPRFAGFVAFGALAVLVFAPLRLDRAAQRAARRGRDAHARRLSRLAATLHPFGAIGTRPAALRVHAAIRAGTPVDDAMLQKAGGADPILREWYRLNTMAAAADWSGLRLSLALPSRRVRMLQLGMGALWVRTVSETAKSTEDVVDAIVEAERLDTTLEDHDRRALFALEAFSALGEVESTRALAVALRDQLPSGADSRAMAAAERTAGRTEDARRRIEEALERADLDPLARTALRALATTLGSAPRNGRSARADALLARLRNEAAATEALSPLREGSRYQSWVTWTLAGAMLGWFLVERATGDALDPAHLARLGGLVVPMEGRSQWWRLLSCTFVHAGWLHLGLNLYALIAFGRFVEAFYGRVRMALSYVLSALGSGLAVAFLADPTRPSILVGASGAIFGLGGALVSAVLLRRDLRRSRRGREELRSFAVLVVLQVVFDRIIPAVSGTAHMAGLVTGIVTGAALQLTLRQPAQA